MTKNLITETVQAISDLPVTNFQAEQFNVEYEGMTFDFNGTTFKSRLVKKTPKKTGYFVAFWHKNEVNINIPFDETTMQDKLIINIIDAEKRGQFIFPQQILVEQGVITSSKYKGKMGMRFYPSWETNLNATAVRTQKWQVKYFVDLSHDEVDRERLRALYSV